MRKSLFLFGVILAAVLSTGLAEAAGRERSVTIASGRVAPHALRIEAGTKVTWRNLDSVARMVVVEKHVGRDGRESDPKISSAALAKYTRGTGQTVASFSHTFVEAGTYKYRLAGTNSVYSIVVDAAKTAPATRTPVATATARAGVPTATATATPIATPKPGAASAGLARCSAWSAEVAGGALRIEGTCTIPSEGWTVELRPRFLRGTTLLVDRVVKRKSGVWPQVEKTVPVTLSLSSGASYSEVIVMPDVARVPVVGAVATATATAE
jgi:plastocyanin